MNILLLGGTGAMGMYLSSILIKKGKIVTVTTRGDKKSLQNLTYVKGNAHEYEFLKEILSQDKWDCIVDFMNYTTEEFRKRVHLLLTSTDHYVFLSSSRVYADSDIPITEDSPRLLDVCEDSGYLETDEYALSKARQENLLKTSSKNNWTIIRPYITFSESRLQLAAAEKESWLYRALKGKSIFFSQDLADKYTTMTYGYDVARGIDAIIGNIKAYGETFHITSTESHKWSEILDMYLSIIDDKTGVRPNVIMLEKWEPFIGGGAMQVKYDRLYNRRFDNTKINSFIDTSGFKNTSDAIQDCLSVFLRKPCFSSINWTGEALKDSFENKWTPLTDIQGIKQKCKYLLVRLGIKK